MFELLRIAARSLLTTPLSEMSVGGSFIGRRAGGCTFSFMAQSLCIQSFGRYRKLAFSCRQSFEPMHVLSHGDVSARVVFSKEVACLVRKDSESVTSTWDEV